jgi:hypothetical protein
MKVEETYQRVLGVANFYIKNASHLSLSAMREFDPNVSAIARDMRLLANIIRTLANDGYDDQNMSLNAFQFCLVIERIGYYVESESEDEQGLKSLVKELEMHTNVP